MVKSISKDVEMIKGLALDDTLTFEAILIAQGQTLEQFNNDAASLRPHEYAMRQTELIVAFANQGWIPNYANREPKWEIWADMNPSDGSGFALDCVYGWYGGSRCGSRLCYQRRDLATYFFNQFKSIYRAWMKQE